MMGTISNEELPQLITDIVARVKHEWLLTVDGLPELVCLVDQDGRIVRANRTVERWGLANVNNIRGRCVHELLHKECNTETCALRRAVSLRTAQGAQDGVSEATVVDSILDKTLTVHVNITEEMLPLGKQEAQPSAVIVLSDISALHDAQQKLAKLNMELESRVQSRTNELERMNRELVEEVAQRRRVEMELQSSRDELATLSQQLINAQEDERHRLSRELHDSLGQSLGAIKYSLERVVAMHKNPDYGNPALEIPQIVNYVTMAIQEARSLATGLRPSMLDDIGVVAALNWLCKHFSDTYTDIRFATDIEVTNEDIPELLSTPIYRIVQEALNNVVKHADAKSAAVSLKLADNTLCLQVRDDGVGYDSNIATTGEYRRMGHIGRLGMRERATNSHGLLITESRPNGGTTVTVEWDLDEVKQNAEQE